MDINVHLEGKWALLVTGDGKCKITFIDEKYEHYCSQMRFIRHLMFTGEKTWALPSTCDDKMVVNVDRSGKWTVMFTGKENGH